MIISGHFQGTRRVRGWDILPMSRAPPPPCSPRPILPFKPSGHAEKPSVASLRPHPCTFSSREKPSPLGLPQALCVTPRPHCLVSTLVAPGPGPSMDKKESPQDRAALGLGMALGECSGMDGGCDRGPYPLWDGQGRAQGRPWLVLTQGKRMTSALSVHHRSQGHQNLPHLIQTLPERGRDLKTCTKVRASWCEGHTTSALHHVSCTCPDRTGAGAAGPAVDGTCGPDMSSEDRSHAGQPQRGTACLCPRPSGPPSHPNWL